MEPVEEVHRRVGLLAGLTGGRLVQRARLRSFSKAAVEVPAQVGADELAVVGLLDCLETDNAPPLEGSQVLVALRKDAVSDQEVPQVFATPRCFEAVDALMGKRDVSDGQRADPSHDVLRFEPLQSRTGLCHRAQGVGERNESRAYLTLPVIKDNGNSTSELAAPASMQRVFRQVRDATGLSDGMWARSERPGGCLLCTSSTTG